MMTTDADVLAERTSADGSVTWQARRSADRGRLIVVGVVRPSDTPTVVLASLVLTAGAPLLMPANMDMGTPSS